MGQKKKESKRRISEPADRNDKRKKDQPGRESGSGLCRRFFRTYLYMVLGTHFRKETL